MPVFNLHQLGLIRKQNYALYILTYSKYSVEVLPSQYLSHVIFGAHSTIRQSHYNFIDWPKWSKGQSSDAMAIPPPPPHRRCNYAVGSRGSVQSDFHRDKTDHYVA